MDATGTGSFQGNGALAVEQTFGPWLFNATGIVAVRTPRFGEQLAPQVTLLGAAAYTLPSDLAFAFSAAYAFEGDARASDGTVVPDSSKRSTVLTLSGLWPVTDTWRVLGGLYLYPPSAPWAATSPPRPASRSR